MVKFLNLLSSSLLATAALAAEVEHNSPDVATLTAANFKESLADKEFSVVKFYAPWCGHCKNMAGDWIAAGTAFKDTENVLVGNVDCTQEQELCKEHGVRGYPTLKAYKKGEHYNDSVPRKVGQIIELINKEAGTDVPAPKPPPAPVKSQDPFPDTYVAGKNHKVVNSNFKQIVEESGKHVFLKVYAPWCGHCKNMAPDWEKFAEEMEGRFDEVIVAEIDATANTLPDGYAIKGYPTVFWCDKNSVGKPEKYQGSRTIGAWAKFVDEKVMPEEAKAARSEAAGKDEL